jgi:ATP-dependent RNA helicase DOB1
MNIVDDGFKKLLRVSGPTVACLANAVQRIEVLESKLLSNPLYNSPRLPELFGKYSEKMDMSDKIKRVRKEIQQAQSVMHLDELKCRKRVLRRLGFTNEADVVQMKARVACEISTGDELVLSELLFNGFFNELTPEQCAACLSCFIFEEKTKEQPAVPEELARSFREIQAQARTIVKVSQESKLSINEDEYLATFKSELMAVVLAWSKGATFAQIWQVSLRASGSNANGEQQADGCVRGKPGSALPAARGAAAAAGAGVPGDWQRGTRVQVRGVAGHGQEGRRGGAIAVSLVSARVGSDMLQAWL